MTTVFPVIAYAQPAYVPPPPPIDPGWTPLQIKLYGWDGSEWDLTNYEGGVFLMPGVRGLGSLEHEDHADDYASIAGAYYRDYRGLTREVYLPLYLYHDGSSIEWMQLDEAFWDVMSAGMLNRLEVTRPDGSKRNLWIRYAKGGEDEFSIDPTMFGWAKYGVYANAHQPYWEGETIEKPFQVVSSGPTSFFGAGDVGGPPFYLQSPLATAGATIDNPGKVEAWPVWTLTGQLTSCQLKVGSSTITVPFALSETDVLVIDTRPTVQTAILNGTTDVTGLLSSFGFAPIPRGLARPISIVPAADPDTTAVVTCSLTALYERAV